MNDVKDLLTVLVGSRAHGVATEASDWDYHTVFVQPTNEMLMLGSRPVQTSWNENSVPESIGWRQDDVAWELGHFLFLATKSNPSVLECFLAPVERSTDDGDRLRALFPYVWSTKLAHDAFTGYGMNQRKKFIDNKDNRRPKYAEAWLRTLFMGIQLMETGTFSVDVNTWDKPIADVIRSYRAGNCPVGDVMQVAENWQQVFDEAYARAEKREPDMGRINAFLLDMRMKYWAF